MTEERNALAELANELTWIEDILRSERYGAFCDEANKAKRIIAELAKVKDEDEYHGPYGSYEYKLACRDAYEDCRAIAEEGAKE